MKKSIYVSALLFGLFWTVTLSAQNQSKPMTNDDIVAMVKAGLPESTIIGAMDAQETRFDNSGTALVELSKQGVTSKVMDAMIAATKKQRDSAPRDAATPAAATGAPAGQQLVGQAPATNQPTTPAQNQTTQTKGANAGAPAQGGFFGRLNQVQTQVNGAVKQGQGTVQDSQSAVKQIQTGPQNGKAAGATSAPAKPSAKPATAAPAPAIPASPAAVTAQQTREQVAAAQKKMADQRNACKQQATAIDAQMRSPESQKAYATCLQAVIQANTPAAAK